MIFLTFLITQLLECGVKSGRGRIEGKPSCPKNLQQKQVGVIQSDLKIEIKTKCGQIVEGRRCPLEIGIINHTEDFILVYQIRTNRMADGVENFVKSRYGSISKDENGLIRFNTLNQIASPPVFFQSSSLLFPDGKGSFGFSTRFFEKEKREVAVSFYKISPGVIHEFIFAPLEGGAESGCSENEKVFIPFNVGKDDISIHEDMVFVGGENIKMLEEYASICPDVSEASFSMKEAIKKIPGRAEGMDISFLDAFNLWVFSGQKTFLVGYGRVEELGKTCVEVFEKIDDRKGMEIIFKIPDTWNEKKFTITQGDGMYRIGKFITVSGEEVIDVLKISARLNLGVRVVYYFFNSWYLELYPL